MKTNKYKIFIVVLLLSILCFNNYSFAEGELVDKWTLYQCDNEKLSKKKESIVSAVNQYIQGQNGYINGQKAYTVYTKDEESENPLTSKIVLQTTVKVNKEGEDYSVVVGSHKIDNVNKGLVNDNGLVSFENLRDKLGGPTDEKELKSSSSWNITMVASVPSVGAKEKYKIQVTEVYEGWVNVYGLGNTGPAVDIGAKPKAKNIKEESDGLAPVWKMLINIIRLVPDFIQMVINSAQSGWHNVGFTPNELDKENISSTDEGVESKEAGNINNYINYNKKKGKKDFQKYIVIPKGVTKDDSEEVIDYEFSEDTEIPFISTDLFTLASNKVSYIDVNFLDVSGNKPKIWVSFRNIIASIVHAVMYIAIGCMMVALIYNGIILVKGSMGKNSISAELKSRDLTQRVLKSTILLVGTVLFEALCIYSNEAVLGKFMNSDDTSLEGSIRVYVEGQNYSFSTTPTGYFRYMTEIDSDRLVGKKALYLLFYTITVLANGIFLIVMFVRMIIMMILAAISFIIVIYYLFCKDEEEALRQYKSCMTTYIVFTLIQFALAVVVRVIMEVGIN